jgi:hypothetical protein
LGRPTYIARKKGERRDRVWRGLRTPELILEGADHRFLRQWDWHPRDETTALFLSWPETALPWQASELRLWREGRSERLLPPGLPEAPCGEALFSPDGTQIAATFRTGEFFQVWLYRLSTANWIQLTFDSSERSLPLKRSGRRSLVFIDVCRLHRRRH